MKADGRTRLEQVLKEANKLLSEYERKIPAESNAARRNELQAEHEKTLQRVREFEELLSVYYSVAESTATGPMVEQKSPLSPITTQVAHDILTTQTVTQDLERLDVVLERLALPHWFTSDMLPMLLSDLIPDTRKQAQAVEELLAFRQVESAPGDNHYSVSEQQRSNLLKSWQEHHKRPEFTRLSAMLADYYAELADHTENEVKQNEWRGEQLYHLVVSDPDQAMQLLRTWFDKSVEERFDLNQAYCWLLMLEERRDLLTELENMHMPLAQWTIELTQRSEYLSARAFWTEEWFRTINYQERDELKRQLEDFFDSSGEGTPWLLNLHAQGGYGKTATIQWLLARYLLPRGFVCALFDYDRLFINQRMEIFQQPHKILTLLSENLNAQRPNKIAALQRQSELRSDPVGHFTLVLRDTYGNKNIVFFIDTLELLLEDDNLTNPGLALTELLKVLVSIREGTIPYGGSIPGYTNLRVVLSGRQPLAKLYENELRQAFFPGETEDGNRLRSISNFFSMIKAIHKICQARQQLLMH